MKIQHIAGLGVASLFAATASADIVSAQFVQYQMTAEDFGGVSVTVNVEDMYLVSNDASDVVLNVYNFTTGIGAESTSFFQSATGAGWLPNNLGSIFDTEALRRADSFVSIGGMDFNAPEQTVGAGGGTGLDPNFGGNSAAAPGALAGWFNSSPPNLNGQVGLPSALGGSTLGVLVGRFTSTEAFTMLGSTFSVTWNQGIGTAPEQASFTLVPAAPAALFILGAAGLNSRRRRA